LGILDLPDLERPFDRRYQRRENDGGFVMVWLFVILAPFIAVALMRSAFAPPPIAGKSDKIGPG
jgi:hypothetical protein